MCRDYSDCGWRWGPERYVQESQNIQQAVSEMATLATFSRRSVTDKQLLQVVWIEALQNSADGMSLSYLFLSTPFPMGVGRACPQTGRNYNGSLTLRGKLLYTRVRAGRGGRTCVGCDCCGNQETLAHILQICSRGWAARISRHNAICQRLQEMCSHRGWTVLP